MKRKLQTSLEFALMAGFVLIFFSIFLFIVQSNVANKVEERQFLELTGIATDVQSEINLALEASDGYLREFDVPNQVGNLDYNIQIVDEMVYINTTDMRYAIALPITNVTGNIHNGTNSIRKQNGEIILNQ